jgi:hypothetical protein
MPVCDNRAVDCNRDVCLYTPLWWGLPGLTLIDWQKFGSSAAAIGTMIAGLGIVALGFGVFQKRHGPHGCSWALRCSILSLGSRGASAISP